jgi:predicted Zn-ribbon and HTH transcriptional regulator
VKDSLFIGKEVGRRRGKIYNKIVDLYQIKQNPTDFNENTPQDPRFDLNSLILELIHIRNSISHHLYKFDQNNQKIELWDENRKHEETFRKNYSKEELIKMEYFLWILNRGLRNQTIYYSIMRKIAKNMAEKEGKKIMIECPYCLWINFEFISKNIDYIICINCKSKIDYKKLISEL